MSSTWPRTRWRSPRPTLARAEASIDYARFNVSQCVITSPINGVVLKKYREVGRHD